MTLSQGALTLFAAVSVAALLLVSSVAEGQAPVCPRPALARLAALAGRWSVDWSYLVDGQLRTVEQATATIDVAAGGCAVRERLEGQLGGRQLAVNTVVAATNDDTLQRVYIDSDHGTLLMFEGSSSGDAIRFLWRRDLGTRQQLVRHEYLALSGASFATETQMSPNDGVEWILVQRARYRRLSEPEAIANSLLPDFLNAAGSEFQSP
jgi:hypothetical protein